MEPYHVGPKAQRISWGLGWPNRRLKQPRKSFAHLHTTRHSDTEGYVVCRSHRRPRPQQSSRGEPSYIHCEKVQTEGSKGLIVVVIVVFFSSLAENFTAHTARDSAQRRVGWICVVFGNVGVERFLTPCSTAQRGICWSSRHRRRHAS